MGKGLPDASGTDGIMQLGGMDIFRTAVNGDITEESTDNAFWGDGVTQPKSEVEVPSNGASPTSFRDDPGEGTKGKKKIVMWWSFETFLMYRPKGGIWVPLRIINWSFSGTAVLMDGEWKVLSFTAPVAKLASSNTILFPQYDHLQQEAFGS